MDYQGAAALIAREFTKILGEPIIEELRGMETGRRDFYVEQVDEVFRDILQIRADHTIGLLEDPILHLTHELLNKFMLYANKSTVSASFFNHFFAGESDRQADSLSGLRRCVEHFQKVAMLRYGGFKRAFVELHDKHDVEKILSAVDKRRRAEEIASEAAIVAVQEIPPADLFLLGFIAGANPEKSHNDAVSILRESVRLLEGNLDQSTLWKDKESLISLIKNYTGADPLALVAEHNIDKLKEDLTELEKRAKDLQQRIDESNKYGLANTNRYLTAKKIDVYFAASMRTPLDFKEMHQFVQNVMSDPSLGTLRLNCFDPTMSQSRDPRTKGLIECLMLKRATAAVYVANERDSFGKDSELATMLVQGKPAVVYVPQGAEYENRAKMFTESHPLSMQVDLDTGVAHGVMVVRTAPTCARLLFAIFTNNLDLKVKDGEEKNSNDKNWYLIEQISQSPIRIVSKDLLLSNCFWNLYLKKQDQPS